jgi:predicted signal transduction protein with EAL and GGDEF domain
VIKIDPSFVVGLGDDATLAMLTRTIIQVGHDLGIEVVAEGIEQPEHLDLLLEMGCGLGQGYLIAKPTNASGIEALVRSGWPGPEAAAEAPRDAVGNSGTEAVAPESSLESGEEPAPMVAPAK